MVQLLRNGFILQLLSIEFIWRLAGRTGKRRMRSSNGQKPIEKEKDKKLMDVWRLNHLWRSYSTRNNKKNHVQTNNDCKISIWPTEDMLPSYFYLSYILLMSKCRVWSHKELTWMRCKKPTYFISLGTGAIQDLFKPTPYTELNI